MRQVEKSRRAKTAAVFGLLALALAIGGCSSVSNMFGSSSSEKPEPLAQGTAVAATAAGGTPADDNIECPNVDVRTGAATLTIGSKGAAADSTAVDLRYQGTIVRTARECVTRAGTMTMKVGIEGRIINGPAGGPGQIDVPLRIAVVHEGPEPKTVLSKFVRIPVTIGPNMDRANFTHIDPEIAFPLPKPVGNIDSYVVYVGFDPAGAPAPVQKPKPKPQRKR
jgi:hypothetical protein